jgi:hypothetical protein
MASNLAYTAAVRGAMSSVEMLSDGMQTVIDYLLSEN